MFWLPRWLPKPVSIPQIASSGPGGTPVRLWMEANSAPCDCFNERPRATMVAAPRLARN